MANKSKPKKEKKKAKKAGYDTRKMSSNKNK